MVEQKASRPIRILCSPRRKSLLPNKRSRLIPQTPRNRHTLQHTRRQRPKRLRIRRPHDLRQVQLLHIEAEEIQELLVVLESVDVHEHATTRIRRVRDEDIFLRTAVQPIHDPSIDGSECKRTFRIRVRYFRLVLNQPEEFAYGGVSG